MTKKQDSQANFIIIGSNGEELHHQGDHGDHDYYYRTQATKHMC